MNNLLTCLLLVACCAITWANKDQMHSDIDACAKANHINEKEVNDFLAGRLSPALAKDNLKCVLSCALKKGGFMDDSGKFMIENAKAKIEDTEENKKMLEALETCKTVSGANPCETAFKLYECMLENGVKLD